jgi:hypothetical protein
MTFTLKNAAFAATAAPASDAVTLPEVDGSKEPAREDVNQSSSRI